MKTNKHSLIMDIPKKLNEREFENGYQNIEKQDKLDGKKMRRIRNTKETHTQ